MSESIELRGIPGFPHHRCGTDGSVYRRIGGLWKEMRCSKDKDGYVRVCFTTELTKTSFGVHRLVLETFVGPCPPGMQCRHLDGNKENNRLENLSWGTARENQEDSLRHDIRCSLIRGPRHSRAKLSLEDIRKIRLMRSEGDTQEEIASKFGVSQRCISLHLAGQWDDILEKFNF